MTQKVNIGTQSGWFLADGWFFKKLVAYKFNKSNHAHAFKLVLFLPTNLRTVTHQIISKFLPAVIEHITCFMQFCLSEIGSQKNLCLVLI